MPRLANIDQATGLPVRKPKPKRYEVDRPGQLVHVDIKSMSTSRNKAGFPTAAGGGSTVADPLRTVPLG